MKRTNRKTKAEAIAQIFILIIGIIAISWMIGGEIKEVSAATNNGATTDTCTSIKFCGFDSNVYFGKRVAGNCVADYSKSSDTCTNGCQNGVCKAPESQVGSNIMNTASSLVGGVQLVKSVGNGAKGIVNFAKTGSFKTVSPGTSTAPAVSNVASKIPYNGGNGWWFLGGKTGIGATSTGSTSGAGSTGTVFGLSDIATIVVWAAIAFLIGRYVLGPLFGMSTKNSQALGWGLGAGVAAGLIAVEIIGASSSGGWIGLAIGVVVAAVVFFAVGRHTSGDIITYTCYQWDAQSGKGMTPAQMTARCKMCNDQKDFPCTEYQCHSLGQGCTLINDANSGRQLCIWDNPNDILPPVITPWKEALLDQNIYKYTPDNAISPPDRGVQVYYTGAGGDSNGCAPSNAQVSFGVQLNEPGRCKISPEKISNYSWMADVFMGRGIRDYNQSFSLSLPSKEALEAENITVENGGKYNLYVRCEDANGNSNIGNFVFKFCISQGPDITAPEILGTSILDNQPITAGQKSMDLNLYLRDQTFTKENATCRWSHLDESYGRMVENMTCKHALLDLNAQMAYTCNTTLTGLNDNKDNKFYFRCIDNLGNANTQSFPLTLIGTRPLVIDSAGPTGTIEDSTNVVGVNLSVETSAGFDEGKAICSFSETGKTGSYVDFFYGNDVEIFSQYQHYQELFLGEGNYTYFLQCKDRGGNMANTTVKFNVTVDNNPPIVVRVYKEENYLKLITDEPGKCVYSNFGCNYIFNEVLSDGNEMTSLSEREFYTDWDISKDYYIKCMDNYGNQPAPDQCSIIARPFEIFAVQ